MKQALKKFYDTVFRGKAAMWTACFTGVLGVFSYLLWQANDISNQTAIATQRAFITFNGLYLEKIGTGGVPIPMSLQIVIAGAPAPTSSAPVVRQAQPPSAPPVLLTEYRVHVPMKNSGTTATKFSTYELAVASLDAAPQEGTNFDALPQSERNQWVFGPQSSYDGLGAPLSIDNLEAVQQGTRHTFVWGWVVYRDTFAKTPLRLSEFCLTITNPRWTKAHNDATGDTAITTLPCATHNCYDENCADYGKRVEGFR